MAIYEEMADSWNGLHYDIACLKSRDIRPTKATLNEPSSIGTSSGSGPRCQETMGGSIAQTRVLDFEKAKTTQAEEIDVSEDESLSEEDVSKQGRISDIDANEDIYLVNIQTDEDMFGVND
ncbi:hypothetical protein Tco_0706323 [Tanacetum coccineum]|uniref:Uncharacterized protein n=1 Tax=Tanacetum coccineum TaxID=301880 RepID=A0ABQ4Y994_9ASTR